MTAQQITRALAFVRRHQGIECREIAGGLAIATDWTKDGELAGTTWDQCHSMAEIRNALGY